MRRFRGCQLSRHLKLPNIYEGMIDASANTRLYYYWVLQIQAWVYFWKSVCSFRVDSILKWRVCIKLKDSWQCAFVWCMSQTSRDRVNSGRVRTHEKNSGEAVRRLGTIIQSIFEPAFAWPFGNGPVRVGTHGFSRLCWKLSSRLFSRPDWRPLGLRGCDHTKFGFYQFQSFLFIVVIVILILFETTFSQISIHSQLLVKILQRFGKEKSTFKSIEKYDLWKTVSKHLKVKSIKMFTERLCDKGIGNVLNFRIEVSLGE